MNRLLLAPLALLLVVTATAVAPPTRAAQRMPTQRQWRAEVHQAMDGGLVYLRRRAHRAEVRGVPVRQFAVNLDIDNTSLASHYDHGAAVATVLRFARVAHQEGMQVFFNSHRPKTTWHTTLNALRRVGYPVDRLCLALRGEPVRHSKRRCRTSFTADGYRLVANVGNRNTDFVGGGYDRAYKLPDYGGRLG